MSDDKGALEQPVVVPQAITDPTQTAHEEVMNPREALEAMVMAKNEEVTPLESDETEAPVAPKKEEASVEPTQEELSNPTERVKSEMLKRINKLTARTKSAEEELAELRAENERLKRGETKTEVKSEVKDSKPEEKREPTDSEIDAAYEKALSEGDHKFAAQIARYLAERTANRIADERIKQVESKTAQQSEAQKKQLNDWVTLCRDYEPVTEDGKVDVKHPLNLSNQNGLLYKTALDLFQDKDLKSKYAGYDSVTGFRIAVNDAYRGIIEQGLYKPVRESAKVVVEPKQVRKPILAEPDSDGADDSTPQNTNLMSDADKVREEIKDRQRNRYKRAVAR